MPFGARFCLVIWAFLALCPSVFAQEAPQTVAYLAGSERNSALTSHMMNLLTDALGDDAEIRRFQPGQTSQSDGSVIITLGPEAFTLVRQESRTAPILALLVDEPFIAGYAERSAGDIGAVLYNSPLIRQAMAGKVILPHATRVAMLATPESVELYEALTPRLPELGMEGRVFIVSDHDDLIPALVRALEYGDFLLAATDSTIYNPRTIKHILLTTYRRSRIVIGPSQAYVKAGSLASTYVPLRTTAESAAQQLAVFHQTGRFPPPVYPDEFQLEINDQVARSLNIPLPPREELRATIASRLSNSTEGAHE
jgi:ABC-type uncharacterized transport system substrate-binding protein